MNIESLILVLTGLVGVGSFIAFLVNALKSVKIVKDGTADTWVTGLNLLALVGVFSAKAFFPEFDLGSLDSWAEQLTELGIVATPFVLIVMKLVSNWTHDKARGLPLVGKTYSS